MWRWEGRRRIGHSECVTNVVFEQWQAFCTHKGWTRQMGLWQVDFICIVKCVVGQSLLTTLTSNKSQSFKLHDSQLAARVSFLCCPPSLAFLISSGSAKIHNNSGAIYQPYRFAPFSVSFEHLYSQYTYSKVYGPLKGGALISAMPCNAMPWALPCFCRWRPMGSPTCWVVPISTRGALWVFRSSWFWEICWALLIPMPSASSNSCGLEVGTGEGRLPWQMHSDRLLQFTSPYLITRCIIIPARQNNIQRRKMEKQHLWLLSQRSFCFLKYPWRLPILVITSCRTWRAIEELHRSWVGRCPAPNTSGRHWDANLVREIGVIWNGVRQLCTQKLSFP